LHRWNADPEALSDLPIGKFVDPVKEKDFSCFCRQFVERLPIGSEHIVIFQPVALLGGHEGSRSTDRAPSKAWLLPQAATPLEQEVTGDPPQIAVGLEDRLSRHAAHQPGKDLMDIIGGVVMTTVVPTQITPEITGEITCLDTIKGFDDLRRQILVRLRSGYTGF
jgi:hypothetical protein